MEKATWDAEEDMKSNYPFLFFALEIRVGGMYSSQHLCFLT